MTEVKYPDIAVQLSNDDGNVFLVLGTVKKALGRAGVSREEIDLFLDEATSGDYDHALVTCMRWVVCT